MSKDTLFLLQAIEVGAAITFLYDWLRTLRRVIPHKQFAISLEDLFFWIFCAFQVFVWMYRVTNGGMRWFAVVGALTGMYLYKKLLSRIFVNCFTWILSGVLAVLMKILRILSKPLKCIHTWISATGNRLGRRKKKILGNFKIWLKSRLRALKIRVCKR
ncbi:MAG: spore cortex biosynthesis protein YabQ [Lachnospiraceae bacterium]|nr:spore cortex biosynthesis protein YabQ [Lachnospiraceae bacterium]